MFTDNQNLAGMLVSNFVGNGFIAFKKFTLIQH